MKRGSSIVGSRELKTRLGQYLARVRRGETILVTDRGEPVAELRPVEAGADPTETALRKLAASGLITLPTRARAGRFGPLSSAGSGAEAVSRDRDERG